MCHHIQLCGLMLRVIITAQLKSVKEEKDRDYGFGIQKVFIKIQALLHALVCHFFRAPISSSETGDDKCSYFLYLYLKGLLHGKISHTLMLCKQFITLKYVNHYIK